MTLIIVTMHQPPAEFMPEFTTKYNPDTGTELRIASYTKPNGEKIERSYMLKNREVCNYDQQANYDAELRREIWNDAQT